MIKIAMIERDAADALAKELAKDGNRGRVVKVRYGESFHSGGSWELDRPDVADFVHDAWAVEYAQRPKPVDFERAYYAVTNANTGWRYASIGSSEHYADPMRKFAADHGLAFAYVTNGYAFVTVAMHAKKLKEFRERLVQADLDAKYEAEKAQHLAEGWTPEGDNGE